MIILFGGAQRQADRDHSAVRVSTSGLPAPPTAACRAPATSCPGTTNRRSSTRFRCSSEVHPQRAPDAQRRVSVLDKPFVERTDPALAFPAAAARCSRRPGRARWSDDTAVHNDVDQSLTGPQRWPCPPQTRHRVFDARFPLRAQNSLGWPGQAGGGLGHSVGNCILFARCGSYLKGRSTVFSGS